MSGKATPSRASKKVQQLVVKAKNRNLEADGLPKLPKPQKISDSTELTGVFVFVEPNRYGDYRSKFGMLFIPKCTDLNVKDADLPQKRTGTCISVHYRFKEKKWVYSSNEGYDVAVRDDKGKQITTAVGYIPTKFDYKAARNKCALPEVYGDTERRFFLDQFVWLKDFANLLGPYMTFKHTTVLKADQAVNAELQVAYSPAGTYYNIERKHKDNQ